VHQDNKVLALGGYVYVLERLGADNLLKYDPAEGKVVYQKHLGDNHNPADLLADGDIGFLSHEDHPQLLKIDLANGNALDSLDLSAYTFVPGTGDSGSAATSPHATRLARLGDTLFVALQRRNGNFIFPGAPSVVLRVRITDFSVFDTLQAPFRNISDMWVSGGNLYAICQGAYGVNDGGLFRWELPGGHVAALFSEADAGGDLQAVVCGFGGECLVQVYRGWGDTQLRRFDPVSGALGDFLPDLVDAYGGLAVAAVSGRLYVGERVATDAGILAFDAGGAKAQGPVSTGLPPYSMAIAEF
jgi:hypothetical protein